MDVLNSVIFSKNDPKVATPEMIKEVEDARWSFVATMIGCAVLGIFSLLTVGILDPRPIFFVLAGVATLVWSVLFYDAYSYYSELIDIISSKAKLIAIEHFKYAFDLTPNQVAARNTIVLRYLM